MLESICHQLLAYQFLQVKSPEVVKNNLNFLPVKNPDFLPVKNNFTSVSDPNVNPVFHNLTIFNNCIANGRPLTLSTFLKQLPSLQQLLSST